MIRDNDVAEDITGIEKHRVQGLASLEIWGGGGRWFRLHTSCRCHLRGQALFHSVHRDRDRTLLTREGPLYRCMEWLLFEGYWFGQIWKP